MYREEEVTVTQETKYGTTEYEVSKHPAFGVVRLCRSSGGSTSLFGSDLAHKEVLRITLCEASSTRDLSRDWITAGKQIAEFSMSAAQWAYFVSSEGRGAGTPVTLNYRQDGAGVQIPAIKRVKETRDEKHTRELHKDLARAIKSSQDALKLIEELAKEPGSVSKKTLQELAKKALGPLTNLAANTAFVYEQFGEAMAQTINEGKIEVEAYITSAISRAGMDAIAAKAVIPQISFDKSQGNKP